MERAVIAGIALLLGGLLVAGAWWFLGPWTPNDNRLWRITVRFERWLYVGGGLIASALGGLILFDHFK